MSISANLFDSHVRLDLSSRTVARQVLSALCSLTSVFGMGTGGPCTLKRRTFPPLNGLVGSSGLEPPTSRLSGARSNHLSYEPVSLSAASVFFGFLFLCPFHGLGGDDGIRTHDPLLAGQVLSQLSYTPILGFFPSSLFAFCGGQAPSKLNNNIHSAPIRRGVIPQRPFSLERR